MISGSGSTEFSRNFHKFVAGRCRMPKEIIDNIGKRGGGNV